MPFFGGDAQFFHTHRQTQENHRCFSFFVGAGRDSGSGVVNPSHSTTLKCVFIPFFIIYLFLFYTFSFFFVLLLLSPAKLKIETNSQGSHVSPTSKKMIKRKETFPNHCVKEKERKEKKRKINVIRWHAISVLFFFFLLWEMSWNDVNTKQKMKRDPLFSVTPTTLISLIHCCCSCCTYKVVYA